MRSSSVRAAATWSFMSGRRVWELGRTTPFCRNWAQGGPPKAAWSDQRWSDQAAFGGPPCAQFLQNGVVLPNSQTLLPLMKDQVAAARTELDRILGQK